MAILLTTPFISAMVVRNGDLFIYNPLRFGRTSNVPWMTTLTLSSITVFSHSRPSHNQWVNPSVVAMDSVVKRVKSKQYTYCRESKLEVSCVPKFWKLFIFPSAVTFWTPSSLGRLCLYTWYSSYTYYSYVLEDSFKIYKQIELC